jgi:carbonic anhydrase/acetyltransferase-like protein (isoleucine patch superfamily)
VTIGHACVIHTATVQDYAVVGMGSIVSDWAEVGVWGVVGEGAVVKQNQEVPDNRIAVGVPARILEKPVSEEYKAQWSEFKKVYVDLARRYPDELQGLE